MRLIGANEIALRLGLSLLELEKLVQQGKFPVPRKVGPRRFYTEEDWRAWLVLAGRMGYPEIRMPEATEHPPAATATTTTKDDDVPF